MFDPDRIVSFDRKSPGAYVFELVRHAYAYPCLAAPAFDALVAVHRNDAAASVFGPLAALAAADGLELWQVDRFEDTLHVALVPASAVDAFRAHWQRAVEPARLRRIEAGQAPLPAPRPSLAVDTADLPADPVIDGAIAFVRSPYSDHPDNGHYFDFSVWPPAKLPLPGFDDPSGFARRWRPVYRDATHNIWSCRTDDGGFRLAQVDDMRDWAPAWLGGGARLGGRRDDVRWMHGMLVQAGEETGAVTCVTAQSTARWYAARKPLHVHPFRGAARCVIVEGGTHLAFADGPVTRADFIALPAPLLAPDTGVMPLHGRTVAFFTATKAHLRLHVFDAATMAHRTCLPGLARDGGVDVRQGHGDWWIINYRTTRFGTIDPALMWNAATGETFAIAQADIPLHRPTIVYQPGLDRYLAVSGETVALLRDFDTIYRNKETTLLRWETLQ